MRQGLKAAGVVVAGLMIFGASLWLIRRLPDNAATAPLKKLANIASGCAAA